MAGSIAYFITFHTFGSWLPGRDTGSVDHLHNTYGTPVLAPNKTREEEAHRRQSSPAVALNASMRTVVDQAIREVCTHRRWPLHAIHVRTNHVHVVVSAEVVPEKVMSDFKAYATRRLREACLHSSKDKVWAEHGSTRYLWTEQQILEKVHYTLYEQGEPLES